MVIAINEVLVPIAIAIGGVWGFPTAIDGGVVPIASCIAGCGMHIAIGGGMPNDGGCSLIQLNTI